MQNNLFRAEDNTALRFYTKPDKNNFQSEKHGRVIYDTVLCVEVITPGSTESVPEFVCERSFCEEAGLPPKRSEYYRRFEKQIEAYKSQNGAYAINGTPLSAWAQIDVGTAATLQAAGIQTVEQLAEVHDGLLQNLGTGGRTLREKAKQWVLGRDFGVPTAQAGTQIAELQEQLLAKDAQIDALRQEVAALRAAPAPAMPEFGDFPAAERVPAEMAPPPPADPFAALGGGQAAPVAPAPALVI